MTDKTTEFINKAKIVHGDKYDYSKVEYINSRTKITIICKVHNEFEQKPSKHLFGQGCPICGGLYKRTNTDFINDAIKIHGDKYDYSKVKYINSQEKVIIICKNHGEFEQKPNSHLNGQGCGKCAGRKRQNNDFINDAIKVHGDKYDYSKSIYTKAQEKVIIICKKHGEFEQRVCGHLIGHGCAKCGIEQNSDNRNYDNLIFIEKAKKIHGELYDYCLVDYKKAREKVKILCKTHGEFQQIPSDHFSGHGCQKCGFEQNANNCRSNNTEFIEKAKSIHSNKYDYSKIDYLNSDTKITIICQEHGDFEQRPYDHLTGKGCSKCSRKQYSKAQIEWLEFIRLKDKIKIQHAENFNEYQIPNTRFKADGYCIETNTIYEFHGDYWHGNPNVYCNNEFNKTTKCTFGELYQSTISKEQQIRDMGFNLITIWESDWIKLNKCIRVLQRKYRSSKH
jgi:hypothetical protein